jgi:hypothetical protein
VVRSHANRKKQQQDGWMEGLDQKQFLYNFLTSRKMYQELKISKMSEIKAIKIQINI